MLERVRQTIPAAGVPASKVTRCLNSLSLSPGTMIGVPRATAPNWARADPVLFRTQITSWSGEARAVWVHDNDSDPTTADLYETTWNGSAWSTPAAVPLASTAGVRELRIAYASDGDLLLAWVGNEGQADVSHDRDRDFWSADVGGHWAAVVDTRTGHPRNGIHPLGDAGDRRG